MKDLNVMEFANDIDAESPMGLLRGIKFGTETYHVLFMRLCRYVGWGACGQISRGEGGEGRGERPWSAPPGREGGESRPWVC